MTGAQRTTIMADWWPAAARTQDWKASDRDLRLRVFSVAVSFPAGHFKSILDLRAVIESGEPLARTLASASELDSREDVDRVKALLLFLADRLQGAREMDHPEDGTGRRARGRVGELLKCLALYPLDRPIGRAGAEALMAELIADMFDHGRKVKRITLEDLSDQPQFYRRKGSSDLHEGPSQLERLVMRLSALLNGKNGYRKAAGHSLHDMLLAAGLPCHCSGCFKAHSRRDFRAVGVVSADPDWTV